MNDSLITEAFERAAANPDAFVFNHLSYWKRAIVWETRNKWAWVYPKDIPDAMMEPITCHNMDHWAEPKPTIDIEWPWLSLWGIDVACRELGFKVVFLEIVKGTGAGSSRQSYGEYKIIFPTEGDAIIYDGSRTRMMLG